MSGIAFAVMGHLRPSFSIVTNIQCLSLQVHFVAVHRPMEQIQHIEISE